MTNHGLKSLKVCFELLRSSKTNELARQTGFIQRERQLKVTNFLSFLFRNSTKLISETLKELSIDLRLHQVPITRARLNKRFDRQCVHFLGAIFEELFQLQSQEILASMPIKKEFPFKRFRILDGTGFKLPIAYQLIFKGTKDAEIKIQMNLII